MTFTELPPNLPVPIDDGAADHLVGLRMPAIVLESTESERVNLAELGSGRTVLYFYPMTGVPGVDLPEGWDDIPGARGCTPEACGFRDHFEELRAAGAARVYGISSQDTEYQREFVARQQLPFAILSDEGKQLADQLNIPTFSAPGHDRLYKRITLIIKDGAIEHVFYPIFPPTTHAQQVLDWLTARN